MYFFGGLGCVVCCGKVLSDTYHPCIVLQTNTAQQKHKMNWANVRKGLETSPIMDDIAGMNPMIDESQVQEQQARERSQQRKDVRELIDQEDEGGECHGAAIVIQHTAPRPRLHHHHQQQQKAQLRPRDVQMAMARDCEQESFDVGVQKRTGHKPPPKKRRVEPPRVDPNDKRIQAFGMYQMDKLTETELDFSYHMYRDAPEVDGQFVHSQPKQTGGMPGNRRNFPTKTTISTTFLGQAPLDDPENPCMEQKADFMGTTPGTNRTAILARKIFPVQDAPLPSMGGGAGEVGVMTFPEPAFHIMDEERLRKLDKDGDYQNAAPFVSSISPYQEAHPRGQDAANVVFINNDQMVGTGVSSALPFDELAQWNQGPRGTTDMLTTNPIATHGPGVMPTFSAVQTPQTPGYAAMPHIRSDELSLNAGIVAHLQQPPAQPIHDPSTSARLNDDPRTMSTLTHQMTPYQDVAPRWDGNKYILQPVNVTPYSQAMVPPTYDTKQVEEMRRLNQYVQPSTVPTNGFAAPLGNTQLWHLPSGGQMQYRPDANPGSAPSGYVVQMSQLAQELQKTPAGAQQAALWHPDDDVQPSLPPLTTSSLPSTSTPPITNRSGQPQLQQPSNLITPSAVNVGVVDDLGLGRMHLSGAAEYGARRAGIPVIYASPGHSMLIPQQLVASAGQLQYATQNVASRANITFLNVPETKMVPAPLLDQGGDERGINGQGGGRHQDELYDPLWNLPRDLAMELSGIVVPQEQANSTRRVALNKSVSNPSGLIPAENLLTLDRSYTSDQNQRQQSHPWPRRDVRITRPQQPVQPTGAIMPHIPSSSLSPGAQFKAPSIYEAQGGPSLVRGTVSAYTTHAQAPPGNPQGGYVYLYDPRMGNVASYQNGSPAMSSGFYATPNMHGIDLTRQSQPESEGFHAVASGTVPVESERDGPGRLLTERDRQTYALSCVQNRNEGGLPQSTDMIAMEPPTQAHWHKTTQHILAREQMANNATPDIVPLTAYPVRGTMEPPAFDDTIQRSRVAEKCRIGGAGVEQASDFTGQAFHSGVVADDLRERQMQERRQRPHHAYQQQAPGTVHERTMSPDSRLRQAAQDPSKLAYIL